MLKKINAAKWGPSYDFLDDVFKFDFLIWDLKTMVPLVRLEQTTY